MIGGGSPIVKILQTFISGRRFLIWHTLLVILASAADHAQVSALFQLFLRETHSSTSILIHASIAVLAQLSALFQLFLRVNYLRNKNSEASASEFFVCSLSSLGTKSSSRRPWRWHEAFTSLLKITLS